MIISLELEIFRVAIQKIHQNNKKWVLEVKTFLVKITLRLFWSLSLVMTMVQTLLR